MKINIYSLLCLLCIGIFSPLAGQPTVWDNPTYDFLEHGDYVGFPAVIIKDGRYISYRYQDNSLMREVTYYQKRHLYKEGNLGYDKVYIPYALTAHLSDLSMRIISPNGDIDDVTYNGNRYIGNCPGGGTCEIFQFDGAKPNDQVEVMYSFISGFQAYGREIFQQEIPVLNMDFQIFHPDELIFKTKHYNAHHIDSSGILSPYRYETYARNQANLYRIDYKVMNKGLGATNTWIPVVNEIIDLVHDPLPSEQLRAFTWQLESLETEDTLQFIKKLEDYLKSEFTFRDVRTSRYQQLDSILTYRQANGIGFTKLFMTSLNAFGLFPEIVATCDRNTVDFDPAFPTYLNVNELMLYFREYNLYLSPYLRSYRLGPPPYHYGHNKALFIHYIDSVGSLQYKVEEIRMPSAHYTAQGVTCEMTIAPSLEEVALEKTNWVKGYRAVEQRDLLKHGDWEQQQALIESVSSAQMPSTQIKGYVIDGKSLDASDDSQPLSVSSSLLSSGIIAKNEKGFSLSIGRVIGPQTELNDSVGRQNPIDMGLPMTYHHVLSVKVPDGYKINNTEEARMRELVQNNDEVLASFETKLSLDNQVFTIEVVESYFHAQVDQKHYERFKKVINSAAQFYNLELKFVKGKMKKL